MEVLRSQISVVGRHLDHRIAILGSFSSGEPLARITTQSVKIVRTKDSTASHEDNLLHWARGAMLSNQPVSHRKACLNLAS